jgi:hypothetical protein
VSTFVLFSVARKEYENGTFSIQKSFLTNGQNMKIYKIIYHSIQFIYIYIYPKMGHTISKAYTPPPLSLRDCLVNGQIDLARYRVYSKRTYGDDYIDTDAMMNTRKRKASVDDDEPKKKKRETKRSVKRHPILWKTDDGKVKNVTFKDSTWYCLYVSSPPEGDRLNNLFRKRFRLPYSEFIKLADELIKHEMFSRWTKSDCVGNRPSDYRLLLLGTLRYLGRGLTFDDIEEYTFISGEVHRNFLYIFLDYGSTILYKKHITDPASNMDTSQLEELFKLAGLNGCLGSGDGTHVGMQQCPNWAKVNHTGFKLAIPSRNYNATVTHYHQILGTTCGHPGTWNDKTLVLFDELIRGVHEGKLYSDYEFQLYELDANNKQRLVTYQGAWFIVDNGYLDWSCTVPPLKHPTTYEQIRFSQWIESLRKDIECTFGILKHRFAILKNGIRLGSISRCDQVWRTCCALHNRLLFIDELDKGWDIATEINDPEDLETEVPFAIDRLHDNPSQSNTSNHTKYPETFFNKYTINGKRKVSSMPLKVFQERLIHHFDIMFKNNEVKWPKRKKINLANYC